MNSSARAHLSLPAVLLSLALSGCAGTGTANDPLEGLNRGVYSFNQTVDKAVLKPVAKGYRALVPDPIESAVSNFFGNLGDVAVAVNDLLQLKIIHAFQDGARVMINSTFGLLGMIDFASAVGIPKRSEDFGQTLGYWGIHDSPYLVLPFLGPSTLRDTAGFAVDTVLFDPVFYIDDVPVRTGINGVKAVDNRANLLAAERVRDVAIPALDEYQFVRDAYLQRRRSLIYDGDPPPALIE